MGEDTECNAGAFSWPVAEDESDDVVEQPLFRMLCTDSATAAEGGQSDGGGRANGSEYAHDIGKLWQAAIDEGGYGVAIPVGWDVIKAARRWQKTEGNIGSIQNEDEDDSVFRKVFTLVKRHIINYNRGQNLCGDNVSEKNGVITMHLNGKGEGCMEMKSRIVTEELYYASNTDVGVRLILCDVPFEIEDKDSIANRQQHITATNISSAQDAFGNNDHMAERTDINDVYQCEHFLCCFGNDNALRRCDDQIEYFNKSYIIVNGYLSFCVQKLHGMRHALETALLPNIPKVTTKTFTFAKAKEKLRLSAESYVMRGVHHKVYYNLSIMRQQQDKRIFSLLERASALSKSEPITSINGQTRDHQQPSFSAASLGLDGNNFGHENISGAAAVLNTLHLGCCPLEKLNCLKIVHVCISDIIKKHSEDDGESTRISADDLLPLLIMILIKAQPKTLATDVDYIQLFHQSNLAKGEYGFYVSNVRAALEYIQEKVRATAGALTESGRAESRSKKIKQKVLGSPGKAFKSHLPICSISERSPVITRMDDMARKAEASPAEEISADDRPRRRVKSLLVGNGIVNEDHRNTKQSTSDEYSSQIDANLKSLDLSENGVNSYEEQRTPNAHYDIQRQRGRAFSASSGSDDRGGCNGRNLGDFLWQLKNNKSSIVREKDLTKS